MRTTNLKKTLVFVLANLIALPLVAQDCKKYFDEAEKYFQKGQYDKAKNIYPKSRDCGDAKYQTRSSARLNEIAKILREREAVKVTSSSGTKQSYFIVPSLIYLPSGTEEQSITIESSGKWEIKEGSSIINVVKKNAKTLVVSSFSENTSIKPRQSSVTIECGKLTRTITIEQDGAPEVLEYKSKYMNIPFNGGKFIVDLNTNTQWKVDYSDWYKATPLNNDSTHMVIHVDKNTKNEDRHGTIIVRSESGDSYDEMEIHQFANESRIFTPVDSIIQIKANGDTIYVPIISDNPKWTESDRPPFCMAKKLNSDTLMVIVSKNENYIPREGFVNIKSNDRVAGIWIKQEASELPDFMSRKILSGRNVSFGVSASYYLPFVSTSAGADYVGSVVDYSLGNITENASYISKVGYSFGLFADIRLYKNFFLIAGANFTQIKYKNTFNQPTIYTLTTPGGRYMKGETLNSYTEDYSHTMIEVPLLASYRFVLNNVSHVQLNLGPVLNFGISSKMKFAGNTDSDMMFLYDSYTHGRIDESRRVYHMAAEADFNLYQPCVLWNRTSTTGNLQEFTYHNSFAEAPFSRINCGLRLGAAYEIAGLSFGISYTMMFTNMANKGYWENKRWTVLNESNAVMKGYKQYIHAIEFKLAYTLRYLGLNKKKEKR